MFGYYSDRNHTVGATHPLLLMPGHAAISAINRAQQTFCFTYSETARVVSANESTLHRWRSGESRPTAVFRVRLAALNDLADALECAFPDPNEGRAWLDEPLAVLRGHTPRQVLSEGRPDLLTGLLLAQTGPPISSAAESR